MSFDVLLLNYGCFEFDYVRFPCMIDKTNFGLPKNVWFHSGKLRSRSKTSCKLYLKQIFWARYFLAALSSFAGCRLKGSWQEPMDIKIINLRLTTELSAELMRLRVSFRRPRGLRHVADDGHRTLRTLAVRHYAGCWEQDPALRYHSLVSYHLGRWPRYTQGHSEVNIAAGW